MDDWALDQGVGNPNIFENALLGWLGLGSMGDKLLAQNETVPSYSTVTKSQNRS
jgi:hypothetical protein